jgi:Protein of unknown function (DUF3500)
MKKSLLFLFVFSFLFKTQAQSPYDSKETVAAAKAFLSSLTPKLKMQAQLSFTDSFRLKWSNLPNGQVSRKGAWLKDLNADQRQKIHTLLRTVLSQQGYQKILFIMQYDEATHQRLSAAKSPIAERYGDENYWISVFGEPTEGAVWAFKFEGHHISLNMTFSIKGITCTPMFTGVNPALMTEGAYAGRYIMYEEDAFGKALFNSLTPILKKKATLSAHPQDADVMVQKGNEAFLTQKQGVSYNEMNKAQKAMVEGIIQAWVGNLTPSVAAAKMVKIRAHLKDMYFTWMGTDDVSQLHYYRLQSPVCVIEFTNRDQGIYHYHTLWRDIEEDFK